MRPVLLLAAMLVLAGTAPAPPAPDPEPAPEPTSEPAAARDTAAAARLLGSARDAFDEGDFATAADLFDQTRSVLPGSPEVLYNLGVARYRNGEYEQAAKLFEEAYGLAEGEDLQRSSLFNLGNAAYAQSEAALDQEAGAGPAMDQLEVASKHIGDALERYRDVLDADPADEAAKVNGETAWRLLEKIKEMQEQLEQQQQQQQDQQQGDEEQPDQEPQEQDEQQEQQSGDEEQDQQQQEQQQDREQQPDEQQQQQQQQQPEEEPSDEQQEQPPPQPGEEEEQQEEQPMPQPTESEEPPMTEDEARRLLQMVRDKERERREQEAELRATTNPKVDKDW